MSFGKPVRQLFGKKVTCEVSFAEKIPLRWASQKRYLLGELFKKDTCEVSLALLSWREGEFAHCAQASTGAGALKSAFSSTFYGIDDHEIIDDGNVKGHSFAFIWLDPCLTWDEGNQSAAFTYATFPTPLAIVSFDGIGFMLLTIQKALTDPEKQAEQT